MKIVLAKARVEPMPAFSLCADPKHLINEARTHQDESSSLKAVTTAIFDGEELECWMEVSEGFPPVLTLFGVRGHEVYVIQLRRGWQRTSDKLVLPSESQWRIATGRPFTQAAAEEFRRLWHEQRSIFNKAAGWCAL